MNSIFSSVSLPPLISLSRLGVQQMIQEMEKLQAKGEVGEEEMRALEIDVTGRVSFTFFIILCYRLLCLPGRFYV